VLRRNETGARRLVESMPPGPFPRVLDVGCGTGFASLAMADLRGAREITGVDPSEGMLERFRAKAAARPELDVTLVRGEVMTMPATPGGFDAVVSSMAFHWFPDKPGAIRAMARALRPGGVLGIRCSGWGTDRELQAVMAAAEPPLPPALVGVFDHVQVRPQDLDTWLRDAGLDPLDVWMDVRVRHQDPQAYADRVYAVSSHMTAEMSEEAQQVLGDAIRTGLVAASGPAGFRYTFCKAFAVARRPD
jgi:SAM-dependent methyltransferase